MLGETQPTMASSLNAGGANAPVGHIVSSPRHTVERSARPEASSSIEPTSTTPVTSLLEVERAVMATDRQRTKLPTILCSSGCSIAPGSKADGTLLQ